MKTKHTIKRYGELWPEYRIVLGLHILEHLKEWVIVSEGWAWHFMSKTNHTEHKHAHDHKDIDLFVTPKNRPQVMGILQEHGFKKVWTRYDYVPNNENFKRYEKIDWLPDGRQIRITINMFQAVIIDTVEVDGWTLVAPDRLLGYYDTVHSSSACWAVKAARQLLEKGVDPVGHPLLSQNLLLGY